MKLKSLAKTYSIKSQPVQLLIANLTLTAREFAQDISTGGIPFATGGLKCCAPINLDAPL